MIDLRIGLPALALMILLPQAAVAARHTPAVAPSCQAGQHLCAGPYGQQCYTPASGQSCRGGVVCGAGQQICSGAFGASCYTAAAGQQCRQGVVCQAGQSVCMAGGIPHCYSPNQGEQCQ